MRNLHENLSTRVRGLSVAVLLSMLAVVANARPPNYDEAKVAPYTLEDPLAFANGRKLKDASEWPARRKEILEIFASEMFGVEPGDTLVLLADRKRGLALQTIGRLNPMLREMFDRTVPEEEEESDE